MKNYLHVRNITEGRKLVNGKPSERIYRSECYTNYKMSRREFIAEATKENYDLTTVRFRSIRD